MSRLVGIHTGGAALVCGIVLFAAAGCSRSDAKQVEENLGTLPWLRHSSNADLAKHLAQIEEQQGTPEQLERDWPPDADNAAVGLSEVFKPGVLNRALGRSDELMPAGPFVFGAVELVPIVQFSKGYEFQRRKVVAALKRKSCRFKIRFTEGLLADTSALDAVRLAVRLENFRVAERLGDGQPVEAVEPLAIAFQLVRLIAAEPHVAYRLEAVALREESLRALAAVAQHPRTSKMVLRSLGQILAGQLGDWPDDRRAWIGDRAIGLHAYEMVRDGQILSMLTDEEYKALAEKGTLAHLPIALQGKGVLDRDQLFYLTTMGRVIDACQEPYFRRKKLFADIRQELEDAKRSSEFRFVSGRMLLPDIETAQQQQARDRARCEAWTLAIAKAVGAPPPEFDVNPLSGKPYQANIESQDGRPVRVVVTGVGDGTAADDEPVVVPIPGASGDLLSAAEDR
ncbi:MAG: hypothetical protein MI757_21410 [Pirellulales bacterium]|nr:hypothetical protein [Pirellulales bacterium]